PCKKTHGPAIHAARDSVSNQLVAGATLFSLPSRIHSRHGGAVNDNDFWYVVSICFVHPGGVGGLYGVLLHHLNQDPRQDDFSIHSMTLLTVGIAILNLLIAVPVRAVRLAATSLLFVFVGVFIFEVGLSWFPGLLVAIVVTAADYSTRVRRNFPVFL